MNSIKKSEEIRDKIIKGLSNSFQKLLEYKKSINGELIIMKDNKIISVKPEYFDKLDKLKK
jgi:hypothetical protein